MTSRSHDLKEWSSERLEVDLQSFDRLLLELVFTIALRSLQSALWNWLSVNTSEDITWCRLEPLKKVLNQPHGVVTWGLKERFKKLEEKQPMELHWQQPNFEIPLFRPWARYPSSRPSVPVPKTADDPKTWSLGARDHDDSHFVALNGSLSTLVAFPECFPEPGLPRLDQGSLKRYYIPTFVKILTNKISTDGNSAFACRTPCVAPVLQVNGPHCPKTWWPWRFQPSHHVELPCS